MKTILLKNVYWYVDKINNIIIPISYNQDRTFVKNLLDDKVKIADVNSSKKFSSKSPLLLDLNFFLIFFLFIALRISWE